MTVEIILRELKAGKYHPVYFLHGDEPYYIDLISDFIEEHALTEGEKAFNQVIMYGKDVDFKTVIDEARQFPMMSAKRVIIVKEAQDMKTMADLQPYLEKPTESAILVLCYKYKKLDKRTKFAKIVEEKAVAFESKKIYDNQVAPWIREYIKAKGYQSDSNVAEMLSEYLGSDLSKISNELDKLILNLSPGKSISLTDVKEQIGISKDFDVFELQRMLGDRNFSKAALIINYFKENPNANPAIMVIGSLFSYFNKVMITKYHGKSSDQELAKLTGVNAFFLKEYRTAARNYSIPQMIRIFSELKKADQSSKGVLTRRADDGAILKDILIACMQP